MKRNLGIWISCLIVGLFTLTINNGCKKDEVKHTPIVTTLEVTEISGTSASCGGSITSDGGLTIISRGVCWSSGINPTIKDNKTTDGAGAGNFSSAIEGLNGGTLYYARAYATNSSETGYGMVMAFTTLGTSPSPMISSAINVSASSATLRGSVNPNYLATTVSFEYGPNTSYGNSIIPAQSPLTGNSISNINATINDLFGGTTYHYRIVATNSLGTTYSNDTSFTTLGQVPKAVTFSVNNIQSTSATLKGIVNANLLETTVSFEYGITESYGNSIPANQNIVTGNSDLSVNANIDALQIGTAYHYRIVASNYLGITYGNDMMFTTHMVDIEGNVYPTISIGDQVWLGTNLKVTKYNDGSQISNVTDNTAWAGLTSGAYCWYNNSANNKGTYGALYNWYVVNEIKNVCPTGWHIPIDAEWTTLESNLGGSNIAGGKIKSTGTIQGGTGLWFSPNTGATNESGFTGLPGGARFPNSDFINLTYSGAWWSSTEGTTTSAYERDTNTSSTNLYRNDADKKFGFSIRCLKD